jgi:ribosomal protein L12E/L44/L45/RPP1/RPP2
MKRTTNRSTWFLSYKTKTGKALSNRVSRGHLYATACHRPTRRRNGEEEEKEEEEEQEEEEEEEESLRGHRDLGGK